MIHQEGGVSYLGEGSGDIDDLELGASLNLVTHCRKLVRHTHERVSQDFKDLQGTAGRKLAYEIEYEDMSYLLLVTTRPERQELLMVSMALPLRIP
jgi:hypothetical protein